jgi:hypothetical protein
MERGQKISEMKTRAQFTAANNPTAPVVSPSALSVESLLVATSSAAITPTKKQEELTEVKSPSRGCNAFKKMQGAIFLLELKVFYSSSSLTVAASCSSISG